MLLLAWTAGEDRALDYLVPLVDRELRAVAAAYLARERRNHTLQTTALMNEVYLRLIDADKVTWHDRIHFFAVSAKLMRHVLIDYARGRRYQKRNGCGFRLPFDEATVATPQATWDVVALHDALSALGKLDERKEKVVELRFFGGLTVEETAESLGISPETVMRDWRFAKLWLVRQITRGSKYGHGEAAPD